MTIKQRQVFYIHGFDPRGARHYHQLYRTQAAQQAKANSLIIKVGSRQRHSKHHQQWSLTTQDTYSQYHYLGWDDLVRQHWAKGWLQIVSDFYYTLVRYILSGNLFKFAKASRKQLMAGLYPSLYLLLGVTASIGLAYYASQVSYTHLSYLAPLARFVVSFTAGALLLGLCLYVLKALGDKLAVFWLQRIYAFVSRWAQGDIAELIPRSKLFAKHITAAINDPNNDEIVIVAHSVGTILAIPTLAQVINSVPAEQWLTQHHKRVVLITLGHCIPLMSFQPQAHEFRAQLQQLAQHSSLIWLDYTAPTDGACFPLLDPITSCGLTRYPNAGPKILSPRFFTLYDPLHYKKLRRAWYTMHFLYLMANDYAGPYDFFAFTAGPKRIVHHIAEHSEQLEVIN